MSELLKIAPRPPVIPRKRKPAKTHILLTIRPVLATDDSHDESCVVLGGPGSERLRKNLDAFRQRYPASTFRFIQG